MKSRHVGFTSVGLAGLRALGRLRDMNLHRVIRATTLLGLVLTGCRPSVCEQTCERVREQLIRDFGVLPTAINCRDPGWQQANTCEECTALLERDYGVVPTAACSADGGLGVRDGGSKP